MSKLPKAVRQQADDANKLAAELANPQPTEGQPEEGQPPVEAPVEGTPTEGAAPDGQALPAEDTEPQRSDETWENKFRTLKGKYDAEIPRLVQANADLKAELAYLKGKFESLESAAPKPAEGEVRKNPKIEEFQRDYPDIYEYVMELQKEKVAQAPDIEDQVKRLTEATQKTAVERFYESLDSSVSDWKEINKDPDFATWLQVEDRYTGASRYELLSSAYHNMNARVVSNIFQDYKNSKAPASDPGTRAPVDKSKFTAPSSTKRSGEIDLQNQQAKKVYPRSEIDRFYKDAALGRLRLTAEQKAAKENEFFAAMQEGRVDPSR